MNLQQVSNKIEIISDFPKQGIIFRNVMPCLTEHKMKKFIIEQMAALGNFSNVDYVGGIDARGFIFGSLLSDYLECGFIPFRKPGKIPNVISVEYGLEYKQKEILCVQESCIPKGSNVLIVDDLIATGSSFAAAVSLVKSLDCNVVGCLAMVEILGIDRNIELLNIPIYSLLQFPETTTRKIMCDIPQRFIPLTNEEHDYRDVILYHHSVEELAIQYYLKRENSRLGHINWSYFPDGQPNISFEDVKYLKNRNIIIFISSYKKEYLLEQISMLNVFASSFRDKI